MPLSEENNFKITKNYADIVNETKLDDITDVLIGESVITYDDLQRINAEVTQSDKNRELIRILIQGPPNGFQIFIQELRNDASYEWLAYQIENTEVPNKVLQTLGNYERLQL